MEREGKDLERRERWSEKGEMARRGERWREGERDSEKGSTLFLSSCSVPNHSNIIISKVVLSYMESIAL